MPSWNSQTGSTNTSKRKKEKRNYSTTDLRQRSHPVYCTICTYMYATQYIVGGIEFFFSKNLRFRVAIASCAGRQLNMPKQTSITSFDLVSNTD